MSAFRSTNLIVLLCGVFILTFVIGVQPACATDYVWDGQGNNDNWSSAENWSPTGVPDGSDDTATIDLAGAVTVSMDGDYTVGELIVGEKATLNIARSKTLTVDGSGVENGKLTIQATSDAVFGVINIRDAGTFTLADPDASVEHEIGGDIVLQNADSVLQITDDDATFAPYFDGSSNWFGNVVGQHDDAQLAIESGYKLKVDVTVQGQMKIVDFGGAGNPTFQLLDDGEVLANVAGTLCFTADVDLDDDRSSLWGAIDSASAVLKFSNTESLSGVVIIDDCATLELCPGIALEAAVPLSRDITPGFCGTIIAEAGAMYGCLVSPPCIPLVEDNTISSLCCLR